MKMAPSSGLRPPSPLGRRTRPQIATKLLKRGMHGVANVCRTLDHSDSRGFHRGHFFLRGSLASGHNRAGMAHAPAGRRGLPADKSDYRLLDVLLDECRGILLSSTADLSDHDDSV